MELVDKMVAGMVLVEKTRIPQLTEVFAAAMDEATVSLTRSQLPRPLSPSYRRAITEKLTEIWIDSARFSAETMIDHFADGFKHMTKASVRDETVRRAASDYVSRYGARNAAQIIRTTEQQIRSLVLGGLSRGQASEAVFSSLSAKVPDLAGTRAELITRTEVHSSSQFVSFIFAQQSQLALKKVWNTVVDDRTRSFLNGSEFSHRAINGVVVPLNSRFAVPKLGGSQELLNFPGDPAGSAGNVINCRCIQTYSEA